MISVLCNEGEREIAREFFELFKTPWEFFVPGRTYPVIISTRPETPELEARLLIVFSSKPTTFDDREGILVGPAASDHLLIKPSTRIPIYGNLASFREQGQPATCDSGDSDTVALKVTEPHANVLRVGYDLFGEVAFLLSEGQPAENAPIPTLEHHISLLRNWILDAGIPVVEIPPIPQGHTFIACLTHDVDFVGVRRHRLDRTFWGFVYRALVGSAVGYLSGRSSLRRLAKNWTAIASLPLVYLGLIEDFWDQFETYAELDQRFSSTFFLIPFKNRVGTNLHAPFPRRRAVHYDICDVREKVDMLTQLGYEIGLHGIDAWHSAEEGRQELARIREVTGQTDIGVRVHWLCFDRHSPEALAQAGFCYDSSFGYNETVGFKGGTTQAFRPLGLTRLLELPLHIQDTALFFPGRLGLTDTQAWDLCAPVIDATVQRGGVLTILWHMRSLAPERLWGDFYLQLQQDLQNRGAWFGTARQVVQWFRRRRAVVFEDCHVDEDTVRLRLENGGCGPEARLFLRVHRPRKIEPASGHAAPAYFDVPWDGQPSLEISLR